MRGKILYSFLQKKAFEIEIRKNKRFLAVGIKIFGNYILFDPIGILSATRAHKNTIKPQKPKKTFGFYLCELLINSMRGKLYD